MKRQTIYFFDYIFFASGTGTTQSGLVCGKIINNSQTKIVGISIARKNPRGKEVVVESVKEYLLEKGIGIQNISDSINFVDKYIAGGYGEAQRKDNNNNKRSLQKIWFAIGCDLYGQSFLGNARIYKRQKYKR
ncbi:MAG: hypothetical protein ACOX2Y_07380 [Christensenellales bacterium]